MIQISTQRECEARYFPQQKLLFKQDEEEIHSSSQPETCATTLQADLEMNGMSPPSPIINSSSSPYFNKRVSSFHYQDQFSAQNLQPNTNQLNEIKQNSNSNTNSLYAKSLHILSPTPYKAINLTQTILSTQASISLSSSSSSTSSAVSSKQSSQSCICSSSQKKEMPIYTSDKLKIKSQSLKKINIGKNLYHSDEDQDCGQQEDDSDIQTRFDRSNMAYYKSKYGILKQDFEQENIENLHQLNNKNRIQQRQHFKEDFYDQFGESMRGKSIRTKLFTQNQITHFTLEDSSSNLNNQMNENTEYSNINFGASLNSNSNFSDKMSSQTNTLYYSQSAPQAIISYNEIDSDDIKSLAYTIERSSAQNPQSKDEEFLHLNSSSFIEDTQEQFKEFLLHELLDKSF